MSKQDISTEWLESLAFFQLDGTFPGVRFLRTNGHEIETYPEFIDREGRRRWYLNGAAIHPRPETRDDVKQLLKRLRRSGK